ncbi:MAG: DUF456 domain-containing protein [Deltaproteobacteria bacterium]|nr:DUF456 domain-containing protein [Deltaproteobacteria bacterium]
MEILFLIISLLLMAAGLVGTFLPIIPSLPLVYGGYLVYGLVTGWQNYGLGIMIAFGLVTGITVLLDYLAGALGAKKFGGTRAGVIGSTIGAIVGVILLNVIGLIIGTFMGAILGELIGGRSMPEAVRSGWGAFLGFVAGTFFKIVAAVAMITAFLWLIIM